MTSEQVREVLSDIVVLTESNSYLVYSICESVYLKNKVTSKQLSEYSDEDQFICWIYGDPDSAIISIDETYVAIGGCGLVLHYFETNETFELFNEPNNILWTESLRLNESDSKQFFFLSTGDVELESNTFNIESMNYTKSRTSLINH